MYCRNCGSPMNDNDMICTKCGSKHDKDSTLPSEPVGQKATISLTQAFTVFMLITIIVVLSVSLIRNKIRSSENDINSPMAGSYTIEPPTEPTEQIAGDEADDASDSDERSAATTATTEAAATTTTTTTAKTSAKTTTSKKTTSVTTTAKLISVPVEPTLMNNHPIRTMQVDIRDDRMHWRIGPGKKYERVNEGGVARGEVLDIYGEEVDENGDRWGYVKRADKFGWIMEKYLVDYTYNTRKYEFITRPEVYCDNPFEFTVLVGGLRLRKGPSSSDEVMCEISKGTRLAELGFNQNDNGKWVYTQYKGQIGWVMAYNGYGHDDPNYEQYVRFDSGMGKPVIYLYPTEKTDVSVKLELLTSDMSVTYPNYGNGWNVTAYPDGRIVNKADGGNYDYLFWESVNSNTHYDMKEGFCVSAEDTEIFLREKLEILGLNERERNEFIVYWLPIMSENKYNYVTFQTTCYTDAAHLTITPKPDTLIRVYMAFVGLDESKETREPVLTTPKRCGFTAVEWGGCEIK